MQSIGNTRVDFRRFPRPTFRGERSGFWPDNVIYAQLTQLAAGALAASAFLQVAATSIPLLLFVHDEPAFIRGWSKYVNIIDGASNSADLRKHYIENMLQVGNLAAAPYPTVFTAPTPTTAGPGELIRCTTVTGLVPVSGYATTLPLFDQSLQVTGPADATAAVFAEVVGKSGVVEGHNAQGGLQDYEGANTVDPVTGLAYADEVATILRVTDYTQAMRDGVPASGIPPNVFLDANGLRVRVVGLHAIPGAPA